MNNKKINIKNWIKEAFHLSILQRSRMAWVDYLRGIAILLVVYRHVLIGLERSKVTIPTSLVTANMIFYSFRMPLFFILSGIFISSSIANRSFGKLVKIKIEKLLYPYLVWTFIQITLQIIFSQFTNSVRSLMDYVWIFIEPKALDQFWYLPALFNTTVVYIILKSKLGVPNWLQLLIGVLLYYVAPHIRFSSMVSDWMAFYVFFAVGDAISHIFLQEKTQAFLRRNAIFLLMVPLFTLAQIYYLHFDVIGMEEFLLVALAGCFSMLILAIHLQKWDILRFLRVLGYHSLFIYVMHVIVSSFTRLVIVHVFGVNHAIVLLFSGIAFGVIIPIIIYNLFIRDNWGWFLFSLHKPERIKRKSSTIKTPAIK